MYNWANQKAEWDRDRFPERFALSTLARAIAFASSFHDGMRDKEGHPAIYHSLVVAYKVGMAGGDKEQQAAAVLHDVIEDTAASYSDVYHHFSTRIGFLVGAMTQWREGQGDDQTETYWEYIARVQACGEDAKLIKIADLEHNLERCQPRPGRDEVLQKEFDSLTKRHQKALKILCGEAELVFHGGGRVFLKKEE